VASIFDGGPGATTPSPAVEQPPVDAAARALGGQLAAGYLALQAVLGIQLVGMGAFGLLRNFDQALRNQQLPFPGE